MTNWRKPSPTATITMTRSSFPPLPWGAHRRFCTACTCCGRRGSSRMTCPYSLTASGDPRNGSLQRIQGLFGHARDRPVREHVRIAAQPEIYLERFGIPGVECDERAGDHHFRKRNVQCRAHPAPPPAQRMRPTASIVFVGYQGVGTPGRKIVDGASSIRLFNEDVAIKAKFLRLAGFPRTPGRARFWIGSGKWRIPVCKSCWCMAKRKHSRSFPALSKTSSIFQCMLPAIWKKWLLRRELLPKWSLPPNRRVMRMWTGTCCLKKRKASFPSSVRA